MARPRRLAGEEGTFEIHCHHPIPVRLGEIEGRAADVDPGGGDEDVEPAEVVHCTADQGLDL